MSHIKCKIEILDI